MIFIIKLPMDQKKFHQEYSKFLKIHANQKRAVKGKAYLYSDLKRYGVSTADRRKFFKGHEKGTIKLE
jgi:hypothetical protein